MTYDKTWTFAYNTTPTDQTTLDLQCKSFVLQLANFLIANGWTCEKSCDSTQYGNSNYWTDLTKVVFGTGVHSWIVLKSPAGIVAGQDGSYTGDQSRLWFEIDCAYASSNAKASFRFHTSNPSTGASTSVAPTTTTQIAYSAQQFLRTTFNNVYPAYFHFQVTSTGEFIAQISYSYAGYAPFILALFPVKNVNKKPSNNYDYPYAIVPFTTWNDSTKGGLNDINGPSVAGDVSALRYLTQASLSGWNATGSVASLRLGTVVVQTIYYGISGYSLISPYKGAELFPATGDDWTGSQVLYPIFVIMYGTGNTAMVGQMADFYSSGQGCAQGSVDGSPVTMVAMGNYWLASNAAPVL